MSLKQRTRQLIAGISTYQTPLECLDYRTDWCRVGEERMEEAVL